MPQHLDPKLISWASILEDNTRDQAIAASRMPFIHPHLALMPDAHLGKGATVGSVIPTVGAIMPAAVGVDIGCLDGETEYLSPGGWHRIDDYHGGEVAQFHPETGLASFVEPLRYIKRAQDKFFYLKTKYGVNQMLTPDHRILCWKIVGRDRRQVQEVVTAAEFVAEHERLKLGNKAVFETAFRLSHGFADNRFGILLSEDQLRVQVMFMADGTMIGLNRGALHLRKQRKIERARKLLDVADIAFTETVDSAGVTTIRFRPPIMAKTYGHLLWPTQHQAEVVVDEVLHWDGNAADRVFFTRDKASADYVQYCFAACGYRASLRKDIAGDGKIDYRVFAIANSRVSMSGTPKSEVVEVSSIDGKAYCFTVPSGFLVLRRSGQIFMTGNCGMIAHRTNIYAEYLPDDRAGLRRMIEKVIPLSAGNYNTEPYDEQTDHATEWLNNRAGMGAHGFDPARYAGSWKMQLGSLGSGNHFIEVTVDQEDRVWLFLHSGSRGVGNGIAQHHIKVAQQLCRRWYIELLDPDLAYLVEGTSEFWQYISEMHWAQKFALMNREEMMRRLEDCFIKWIDGTYETTQKINCHHNYTVSERHFNRQVWLSRKGAIDAHEGVWGLIPGSMGTASYVVQGKGNPVALHSSPHGAGRNFSRSAARKKFTIEDLNAAMEGIEWSGSKEFLDEHPEAYKPVEQVMEDAADLVEVRYTLHQILNVKGD